MFTNLRSWWTRRRVRKQLPESNLELITQQTEKLSTISRRLEMVEQQSHSLSKQFRESQSISSFQKTAPPTSVLEDLANRLETVENKLYKIQQANAETSSEYQSFATHRAQIPLQNDKKLLKLLASYEKHVTNEKFVPVDLIIQDLIQQEFVVTEAEANGFINQYAHAYPKSIRIEQARGKTGRQIAIYINKLIQEGTK